ncbi:ribose-phosphate pyrophosphokinase, partial [bacterium]|nr:ribose-phosphate pyrophosphokinase [bacterium]MBU1024701.1 ribose-phosphate pyrophosphokinase [bacterium]
ILTKKRTDDDIAIYEVIGDVAGMNAIIFDDEVASGGTLKEASIALRVAKAKKIFAAVTHAVFGEGIHKNLKESNLEEIIVTDTIPVNPDPPIDKLTVLHVAKTFGEAVKRIHTGDSISQLIKEGV